MLHIWFALISVLPDRSHLTRLHLEAYMSPSLFKPATSDLKKTYKHIRKD
jgi:hypothetical protein